MNRPSARAGAARPPRAVLFDRDDTLIIDVPYLTDPSRVCPVPGAGAALAELRTRGIATGVASNQSGVARGLISPAQLAAVNARVEALLGPFDTWQVCPHGPDAGCDCRKPAPGLVVAAARDLSLRPADCVMIGDTGADVAAGLAAGACAILVPTRRTRPEEVAYASRVATVVATLTEAVHHCMAGGSAVRTSGRRRASTVVRRSPPSGVGYGWPAERGKSEQETS